MLRTTLPYLTHHIAVRVQESFNIFLIPARALGAFVSMWRQIQYNIRVSMPQCLLLVFLFIFLRGDCGREFGCRRTGWSGFQGRTDGIIRRRLGWRGKRGDRAEAGAARAAGGRDTAPLGLLETLDGVAPGAFGFNDSPGDRLITRVIGSDYLKHVVGLKVAFLSIVGALQTEPATGDLSDEHAFVRVDGRVAGGEVVAQTVEFQMVRGGFRHGRCGLRHE